MRIRVLAGISTIVLLSLVSVLIDYFRFSYTILTDLSYWVGLFTERILIVMILFTARSLYKWGEMAKNVDFVGIVKKISKSYTTIYTNTDLMSNIDSYIAQKDRERKKKAIEKMLSKQMLKLKKKLKKVKNTKKLKKLQAKLDFLNEQKANIELIVDVVKIKYAKISLSIIFGGQEQQKDTEDDLRINETGEYVKIMFSKMLGIIAIGILFGSSAFLGFTGTAGAVICDTCIKLFQIAMATYIGANLGISFVRGEMLTKMMLRLSFIQAFFAENNYQPKNEEETPA